MAFEVRCPDCRKLYSAEWRLVGKRIRCRQCAQVFTVGAPAETSALVTAGAAAEADGPPPIVAATNGSDTAAVVVVPRPPAEDDPIAAAHFEEERSPLRASRPQLFPGSQVLEAWLPLALGLITVIWCASETFTENHTGKGWVPLLRMAALVALYMLLIVPVTLMAVRKQLARIGRALPPSTMQRVAVTFALPVTLAYVFWLVSGGIPAVITGLVLGLVLMAAVFWLLFRIDADECASAYAIVGGMFLAATTVAVGVLCGANFLLNRAMMASHATAFKESPLGTALAWQVPSAEPAKIRPRPGRSTDAGSVADASPQTPDAGPTEQPVRSTLPIPGRSSPPPDHSSTAFTFPRPFSTTAAVTTAPADDTDLEAGVSELFGPSGPPSLSDAFIESIQQAKLPWVQRVYRPADEGVFEDSLSPITPSPYIALVRLAGIGGKTLECCRLTPWFRTAGAVPMNPDGSDSPAFSGRCALSPDGKLLLRLTTDPSPKIEVVPLHGAGRSILLTLPKSSEGARVSREDALLTPELLGVLPRQRFLVRWSRTGEWILQVYSLTAPEDKPSPINIEGESDANGVYAVSADGNSFATVVERPDSSVVAVYSLISAESKTKALSLTGIADPAQWEWGGLSFSPDGTKVAALLERDSDGIIRSWTLASGRPAGSGSCKVPSADERLGHARGRLFDCLADNIWLAGGRTLLDSASGRMLGTLTSEVVISQQVADGHTFYLSYALGDGGRHVAIVKLDTEGLNGGSARSRPH